MNREERLSGVPDDSSTDRRSAFQRDRDRIIYLAQFRRLGGITQVTSPTELHTFHNRLTHTLEVAQTARRIAENFFADAPSFINPDVCETAALIHDLGHPPFGHNGEKILNQIAFEKGQPDGFEGNAQSFRIVTKLAVRVRFEKGLDLTVASLRASLKYPWLKKDLAIADGKFGVYSADQEIFDKIWETGTPGEQNIEAAIMDWSDDVAYSTHDFYDFAMAGMIPLTELRRLDGPQLRRLLKDSDKLQNVDDDVFGNVCESFDPLPKNPTSDTSRMSSETVGQLKEWVSTLIQRYATAKLSIQLDNGRPILFIEEKIKQEVMILKALTYHYAIASPALAMRQRGEQYVLKHLFNILYDDFTAERKLASSDTKSFLDSGESPVRVVLDVICSLTDAQATSHFHRLTGISHSSILDASSFASM